VTQPLKFKDNVKYFKEILHAMMFTDYCKEQMALWPESKERKNKTINFDLE
jgi:hypothetical protein